MYILFWQPSASGFPLCWLWRNGGDSDGDDHYTLLARRWARGYVITVAVGVVTGTAIGLQLSLLWPTFMRVAGKAIALPLFMETFAFCGGDLSWHLSLYVGSVQNKWTHLLLLIPVAIGSSASAFFITSMNAFMNQPQGFELVDGVFTNVNPFVAMFNPATPTKVSHVLASAFTTSAAALASIAAFSLLRGAGTSILKSAEAYRRFHLCFAVATVMIGDFSGKFLAKYQPEKLAAAEWHFETMTEAPLIYGGFLDENNEIKYALKIPYALSILAGTAPVRRSSA